MGKFIFLAVFLATLVAVSVAQSEQSFRDVWCRREVQQKPLHACRQILQHKQTGGGLEGAVSVPLFQREWDTRERCCRQLQSVRHECRCSAIRGMVRDYEETMPKLGQGHTGSSGEQQEQGYYEHREQGGGYYGEEGRGQQGQVLRHERPEGQQQQAGQGYYGGETAESEQRQGGGYYGERPQHQHQQHGKGFYGETSRPQVGGVSLMQVRRYVAGLPTVCQIEPMECSVFSDDQY